MCQLTLRGCERSVAPSKTLSVDFFFDQFRSITTCGKDLIAFIVQSKEINSDNQKLGRSDNIPNNLSLCNSAYYLSILQIFMQDKNFNYIAVLQIVLF